MLAREIMNPRVTTVDPEMLVTELATMLLDKGYSGVPVVDEGELVGVASFADIAAYASRPDYYRDLWLDEDDFGPLAEYDSSARVRDIMTPVAHCVTPEATLLQVVEEMRGARIHRVFVAEDGRLEGIITTMDLIGLIPEMAGAGG